MRPLVNLVRHHPDGAQREAEDHEWTCPGRFQRNQEKNEKNWHCKKSDVAVGVDKTPPQKIIRIDVMQAEGNEKAAADDGKVVPSPGVGAPMNQPGREVGRRDAAG